MPNLPPAGPAGPPAPPQYRNPFRDVAGLQASRIDQGVDYSGTGPVYALGPGKVVYSGVGNTGWGPANGGVAPGGYIGYMLTGGPLAGNIVYVAEGITPTVQVGDTVTADTKIGDMSAPIESGWASGQGTESAALAAGQWNAANDSTAYGVSFSNVIALLGGPAGKQQGTVQGNVTLTSANPSDPWYQKVVGGLLGPVGGIISGATGAVSGITEAGHWISVLVADLTDIHMYISLGWLWLGLVLLFLGIYLWFRMSDTYKSAEASVIKAVAAAA